MKTNKEKLFAGLLAAAVCLVLAATSRAFWTVGGQAGGAFEQLGITAETELETVRPGEPPASAPVKTLGTVAAAGAFQNKRKTNQRRIRREHAAVTIFVQVTY